MRNNNHKEIQTKLTKGLLDTIILDYLSRESMYGYQIITQIKKNYGIYFGPSTIYPLLGDLEKKGYLKSTWNMDFVRPRKVFELTKEGKSILTLSEDSLNLICKKMTIDSKMQIQMSGMSSNVTRQNF